MKLADYKKQREKLKKHCQKMIKRHEILRQNKFGYKEKLAHELTINELRKVLEILDESL